MNSADKQIVGPSRMCETKRERPKQLRGFAMSGISSLSASGPDNLFSILTNSSKTSGSKRHHGKSEEAKKSDPLEFLSTELQDQGYSGASLETLLTNITDAVKVQGTKSDGTTDPAAIHDAIDKVLKDAGVDTDKIDRDLQAQKLQSPNAAAASSDQVEALLTALKSASAGGSSDASKMVASAIPGSLLNLQA
jgi:hypothetical protein